MIDFRSSQIHYSRFVPNSLSIEESQGNEKKFWKALKKTLPYTLLYFSDMFLVSYDVTSFFSSIFLSETIDLAVNTRSKHNISKSSVSRKWDIGLY